MGCPIARWAASTSIFASSDSVRMRIGLAEIHARFTPSTCAMITCASVRSMLAMSSSRAAFTVCTRASGILREARELLGLVLGGERRADLRQVAVHDRVDLVQCEFDAGVGDAPLRKIVGADAIRAVARADEALPLGGFLRRLLAHLLVLDARGEDPPGLLAVLVLAPRVLALDHDAGGAWVGPTAESVFVPFLPPAPLAREVATGPSPGLVRTSGASAASGLNPT